MPLLSLLILESHNMYKRCDVFTILKGVIDNSVGFIISYAVDEIINQPHSLFNL